MGTRELAAALKISPGLVSRLTKRGMPMSSTEAANAWREIHAPPRQRPSAQPPIPALFNKPPQCNAGPSLQDDDLDLSGLDENIPWLDFAGDEIADIELDDEILSTPTRQSDEPPAGLFALSKNRFLHQFHATKAADKNKRRSVKKFIRPENALQILDYLPDPGDTTHAVVRGDFVLGEIVPVIIGETPAELVAIATLGMSAANATQLADLRSRGLIRRLRVIVSHYFAGVDKTGTFADVCRILGDDAPKVCRNHSKIILIQQRGRNLVIAGSANLRSSDNIEQFSIWNDPDVFAFHLNWMDEIHGQH
jgi:hypothetical protein